MQAPLWTPKRLASMPKARRKPPFLSFRRVVKLAAFTVLVFWIGGVAYFLSTMVRAKQEPELKTAIGLHPGSECPKMIYWRPHPAEDFSFEVPYAHYRTSEGSVDPLAQPSSQQKYATFELDYGFDNIRMALETVTVFARATGRIVVLPPEVPIFSMRGKPIASSWVLGHPLGPGTAGAADSASRDGTSRLSPLSSSAADRRGNILDFFAEGVVQLNASGIVRFVTFDEFLRREGSHPGGLVYEVARRAPLPQPFKAEEVPKDVKTPAETIAQLLRDLQRAEKGEERGGSSGANAQMNQLWAWVRRAVCSPRVGDGPPGVAAFLKHGVADTSPSSAAQARCPRWDPTQEAVVFGASSGAASDLTLAAGANETLHGLSNPFANPAHGYTLSSFLTPQRRARVVDAPFAGEEWVHFTSENLHGLDNYQQYGRPLSAQWYTLFYFEDYATDLHLKRLVRDYLRYSEAVVCAAGRIVAALDREAREHGTTWSSMHVKHGESEERREGGEGGGSSSSSSSASSSAFASPKDLLASTSPWLNTPGELLYVATDEPDLTWFAPLGQRHATRFLRDYASELEGLPSEFFGIVEQVVLSHGRTFTATDGFSAFSAYVCRLRGYHHGQVGDESCYSLPSSPSSEDTRREKRANKFEQQQEGRISRSGSSYASERVLAWEGIDYRPPRDVVTAHGDLPPDRLDYQLLKPIRPSSLKGR